MHTHFKDYNLSNEILRALNDLHYSEPTEVQQKVIPNALQNRDLVVKSQTGSGKTAAFAIPLCEKVEWLENKPQALILTPTRELAQQIKEDITNIGRFKRIKATAIYGKQPFNKQKLELKQKSHIVVGTPGRVMDHISKGTLIVDEITYLVVDEADEMLNMGFIDQVEEIIETLPKKRVTSVYSATLPKDVENLCHQYMSEPTHIEIKAKDNVSDRIEQYLIEVSKQEKFAVLQDITITENPDSCLIFCRTQEQVDYVTKQLKKLNYPCDKIHGGLDQDDRFSVMKAFKRGEFRYLVATDVAARGIDVENVSLVLNYDIPMEKESYVHRIGRTGRAGKKGKAITLITPYEEKFLSDIEEYIDFTLKKINPPIKTEVDKMRTAFKQKIEAEPDLKIDKSAQLNQSIMKLYFNGGKKKKIRAVDFVGTISRIDGVESEDIGIITIEQNLSYVEILNGKGPLVLKEMKHTTVKGKQLKVHEAKK
ncbi:ATP-dependent RNA helicase DbpA [Paraliobacillus quinghaiensis]|uniref:ATP-dependent RNA helicase DbpA n=1 Tax=Paraliobacillus quinghaiensis TaxID=470815 RepID=A0A917TZ23_9BACI|nr:DEAD/DEAH box helicase [Paraliobacillus quinghaiensis]GGM43486.1 ATP-dependent RNA helicase DbpA [Paraliobacillus quinghaiensis]